MFLAPVQLAMPNGKLPAFNDSTEVNVRNDEYELAWSRFHESAFALGLTGTTRRNEFALFFGADDQPTAGVSALASRNFPASGYAILQKGTGDQATWLCLKYGPHGGGHGHPDKNNFVLYSRGRVLFPDSGTRPYGSPLHNEWDKVTLAHNTLVVDGASQAEATGKALAFGDNFAMTDAGNIYPGVHFVRTAVLLNENLVLFVDRVTADKTRTFDLAAHVVGRWVGLPLGEPLKLPNTAGYQHLQNATVRDATAGAAVSVDGGVSIILAQSDQLITATGVGASTEDRVPVAIFRHTGDSVTWVWAAALDGKPVTLRMQSSADTVTVRANSYQVAIDFAKSTVSLQ
jgi:hypothetical protein